MIRSGISGGRLGFRGIDKLGSGFRFGSGCGSSSPAVAASPVSPRRLTCSAAGFNQYAILGLSPFASKSDVKHAYKRLALKYHPDVSRGDTVSAVNETFREIKSAYESIIRKLEEEEEMRTMNSVDEWDEWDEWMGCEGGIPIPTYTA
ncbi:hypothetical protein V2J09_004237 [Rumex salicifolius]